MDEEKKPFDIVSIIILMMIAVANDAAEIVFDILAATGVGLPGEAIMKPIDLLVDGIVTSWFFFKVGFGGPAGAQLIDDVLEVFGIPGRTICVGLGIWIANHPKSHLGQAVNIAATVEGGGAALGEVAGGVEAAEEVGAVAGDAEKAGETAERAPKGKPSETPEEADEGEEGGEGERAKTEHEKEVEEELTPEAEKNPVEVQGSRLNRGPTDEEDKKDEDGEDEIAA